MIHRLLILWARLIDCGCVEDDLPASLHPGALFGRPFGCNRVALKEASKGRP